MHNVACLNAQFLNHFGDNIYAGTFEVHVQLYMQFYIWIGLVDLDQIKMRCFIYV